MQKLAAFILLLAFTGQTFRQGFYYVDYTVDKAAYVKNCVNKARPLLHCDGKCQLMKKIEEQEKKEQQKAPEMKLAGKIEVLPTRNETIHFNDPGLLLVHSFQLANQGKPVDQVSSFFHPPSA